MRKWLAIAGCLMLLAVFTGIVWSVLRPLEPSYEGRKLSSWLDEYDRLVEQSHWKFMSDPVFAEKNQNAQAKAREAIAHIGTNAIPTLLEYVRYTDGRLKKMLVNALEKQNRFKLRIIRLEADHYHSVASNGFSVLGGAGKGAVPELMQLLPFRKAAFGVQMCASRCLGYIGPDAKPAVSMLLPSLHDTNARVQWWTLLMLGRIHQQPGIVVPALIDIVKNTNAQAMSVDQKINIIQAIQALNAYGKDAKLAIPYLQQFTNSASKSLEKSEAEDALKKINSDSRVTE